MVFELIGLIIVVAVLYSLLSGRISRSNRTHSYRKDVTNMFVVGKIKQYAKEEGIDLKEEFKHFFKIINSHKRYNEDYFEELDDTVEQELQTKIETDREKLEKKTK